LHSVLSADGTKEGLRDMKISTKGRYALILMLDLAVYNTGEPVRLKDVAKRQQISEKYLEQIISILNKAGFVRSVRGPQGGYMLNGAPENYTVGMILRQTEGSLSLVSYDGTGSVEREAVLARLWTQLEEAIDSVVDNITLKDMVEWHTDKANDYVI
jgi:Rrf2 family protein